MSLSATTSRTDAHRVFAALYQKKRSPEHQRKVDEVLTRSNDVFIRIDLIKKLDKEFEDKERKKALERNYSRSNEEKKETGRNTVQEYTDIEKSVPQKKPNTAIVPIVPKEKKHSSFYEFLKRFMMRVLGVDERISNFSDDSGAIIFPIFSSHPKISPKAESLFTNAREDGILDTLIALQYCEANGWRFWDRKTYNLVMNFSRFIREFLEVKHKVENVVTAEEFLNASKKLQMYYARHVGEKDSRQIILQSVLELIKNEEKFTSKIRKIFYTLNYLLELEKNRPRLTDVISGYYTVAKNKMVSWENVVSLLAAPPIETKEYQGSLEVIEQIRETTDRLERNLKEKLIEMDAKKRIKNSYFIFDSSGKLVFSFINNVVNDYLQNYYFTKEVLENLRWKFKNFPHWFLQLATSDLKTVFFPVLKDYVGVEESGELQSILIANKNVFFNEIEQISKIQSVIENFNRRYSDFQLTFDKFSLDFTNVDNDQVEAEAFQLIRDASDLFVKFARKLDILLSNHRAVQEFEKDGKITDEMLRSYITPVTDMRQTPRFIPYFKAKLVSGNRLNGSTIFNVIFEFTKCLYNYAAVFKNGTVMGMLAGEERLQAEIDKMKKDYTRLTGKPFDYVPGINPQKK